MAIPLVFELGCVTLLAAAEQQAEQEAIIANRARAVSDQVNRLNGDLYSCFQLVRSSSEMNQVELVAMHKSFKELIRKLQGEYQQLEKLIEDNPAQLALVKRSSAGLYEAASIVDNFERRVAKGDADYDLLRHSESGVRLASLAQRLFSQDLKLFAEEERHIAEDAPERLSGYRHQILTIAFLAVAVGMVFSILVAIFLVRDITGRLKVLSANAARIAQGRPLLPEVGGADEIGDLDESFRKMVADLERAQNERQELISMITHDLRSPLATISGFLELLQEGLVAELTERGEKLAMVAQRNVGFMMRLIADLLDVEKARAGMLKLNKTEFELGELLLELDSSIKEWAAEQGVKLQCVPCSLIIRADRDMLKRVLFNLVSNALKFSPRDATVAIGVQKEGSLVQVSVSDEGQGIPPEKLSAIFERFVQVDSADRDKKGGSGLGLAICKTIVELHGGRIWAKSRLGQGSTFCFTLPL